MARSLDFYLALDCEVRCAADGWALLCSGPVSFVLIQATAVTRTGPRPAGPPGAADRWIRLTTPDVRTLRRRLLAEGVPAGPVVSPANIAEIEAIDPDLHCVVIAEPAPLRSRPTSTTDHVRGVACPGPRSGAHLVSVTTPRAAQ